MDRNYFSKKIKEIMDEKGITQRELAEKVGLTEVTLSRYIRGDQFPCSERLHRISDSLNVDPYIFLKTENDHVNHPSHYQGKHECIDEMVALFGVEAVKHFCMCNVYKYRFRAAAKNGQEDLDKADWYMDKLMALEGGNNG